MRRFLIMVLVAACLWPGAGPVRAQATADQLNKLSLEALTTPAPGGNPGPSYRHRSYQRSFYHGLSRTARVHAYRRGASVQRASARRYRAAPRRYGSVRTYRGGGHAYAGRAAPRHRTSHYRPRTRR